MSNVEHSCWNPSGYERPYRRLDAWQHGTTTAKRIYRVTRNFPDDEKFGLVSQLRRSAVSVPNNIAEGAGRGSSTDFRRFLYMARGSLNELDTGLEIAADLGYLSTRQMDFLEAPYVRLWKTLNGLIRSIDRKQK